MAGEQELSALRKLNAKLIQEIAMLRQQSAGEIVSMKKQVMGNSSPNGTNSPLERSPQKLVPSDMEPTVGLGLKEGKEHAIQPAQKASLNHIHSCQENGPLCGDHGCDSCALNSGLDTFRRRLSEIIGTLVDLGHDVCEAWERIKSMETKVQEILPADGSVGRKERRQLKGARVQEIMGVLQSLAKEIKTCKRCLTEDCTETVENIRSDLFEVLLGVDSLLDHRRQELQGLNEAGRQIRELGIMLDRAKHERHTAILEREELQRLAEGRLSDMQERLNSVNTRLNEVVEENGCYQRQIILLEDKVHALKEENSVLDNHINSFQDNESKISSSYELSCLCDENEKLKQRILDLEGEQGGRLAAGQDLRGEIDRVIRDCQLVMAEKDTELVKTKKELAELKQHRAAQEAKLSQRLSEDQAMGTEVQNGSTRLLGELEQTEQKLHELGTDPEHLVSGINHRLESQEGLLLKYHVVNSGLKCMQHHLRDVLHSLRGLAHEIRFVSDAYKDLPHESEAIRSGSSAQKVHNTSGSGSSGMTVESADRHLKICEGKHKRRAGDGMRNNGPDAMRTSRIWHMIGFGGSIMAASFIFGALRRR